MGFLIFGEIIPLKPLSVQMDLNVSTSQVPNMSLFKGCYEVIRIRELMDIKKLTSFIFFNTQLNKYKKGHRAQALFIILAHKDVMTSFK